MSFHRRFADNTNPSSVASRLRRRRFEIFRRMADACVPPVRVLDVGGTPGYWSALPTEARWGLEITLLNLVPFEDGPPWLQSVAGDARDLSQFGSDAFDIVFSNSVIEHVGTLSDQRAMAREVQRVGRDYYVQTPNRRFPVEPHFQFPLFQYLPEIVQIALVQRFDLGWYERIPDRVRAREHVRSIRLLSRRECEMLFPEATVVTERFLGMAKSFVIVSGGVGVTNGAASVARP